MRAYGYVTLFEGDKREFEGFRQRRFQEAKEQDIAWDAGSSAIRVNR